MTLETSKLPNRGLGISKQTFPETRHYIARIGRTEARVIVWNGQKPSFLCVACLLVAGLTFFKS